MPLRADIAIKASEMQRLEIDAVMFGDEDFPES